MEEQKKKHWQNVNDQFGSHHGALHTSEEEEKCEFIPYHARDKIRIILKENIPPKIQRLVSIHDDPIGKGVSKIVGPQHFLTNHL